MKLDSDPVWLKESSAMPLTPFVGQGNRDFNPPLHAGCETGEDERKPRTTAREVLQALLTPGTKGSAVSSD